LMDEWVYRYMVECDRRYETAYVLPDDAPDSGICRQMLALGFDFSLSQLKQVCVKYCGRWATGAYKSA